jgi:hypothetical protein
MPTTQTDSTLRMPHGFIRPATIARVAWRLAALLVAAGCQASAPSSRELRCASPAPLTGRPDARAPGYIVLFHDSVDANVETTRLAAHYGFSPRNVYNTVVRGFAAEMTPATLAAVRCERSVQSIGHNGVLGHATGRVRAKIPSPAA